ncbi:hypothetical protein NIES4073_10870 [Kalymmatonema gypsitolerans NIES-4073]|nr:hypothetical protein NIES4073_10870 [Scytonema sp. NIES-4073]
MVRFLADENFNNQIVRGILRRKPNVDIVRVQDMGLSEADDPTVLEWAAQHNRVVLTHDIATMTNFAYERIQAGQAMSGLFEVSRGVPVGLAAQFLTKSNLPSKASDDAIHIATATVHGLDYLLTWNCKHIANAQIQKKLTQICFDFGYKLPTICTPYELMGE